MSIAAGTSYKTLKDRTTIPTKGRAIDIKPTEGKTFSADSQNALVSFLENNKSVNVVNLRINNNGHTITAVRAKNPATGRDDFLLTDHTYVTSPRRGIYLSSPEARAIVNYVRIPSTQFTENIQ